MFIRFNVGLKSSIFQKSLLASCLISVASISYGVPGGEMVQAPNCSVVQNLGTNILDWPTTVSNSVSNTNRGLSPSSNSFRQANVFNNFPNSYSFELYSQIPPTFSTLTPLQNSSNFNEPTLTSGENVTMYLILGASPQNEVCTYEYTLSFDGTNYNRTVPTIFNIAPPLIPNPTAVPIFTPVGILVMISGLFWFSRRPSMKFKNYH